MGPGVQRVVRRIGPGRKSLGGWPWRGGGGEGGGADLKGLGFRVYRFPESSLGLRVGLGEPVDHGGVAGQNAQRATKYALVGGFCRADVGIVKPARALDLHLCLTVPSLFGLQDVFFFPLYDDDNLVEEDVLRYNLLSGQGLWGLLLFHRDQGIQAQHHH